MPSPLHPTKMESMAPPAAWAARPAVPKPAPPICVEPLAPPVKPVVVEPLKFSHQSQRISKFSVIAKPSGETLQPLGKACTSESRFACNLSPRVVPPEECGAEGMPTVL